MLQWPESPQASPPRPATLPGSYEINSRQPMLHCPVQFDHLCTLRMGPFFHKVDHRPWIFCLCSLTHTCTYTVTAMLPGTRGGRPSLPSPHARLKGLAPQHQREHLRTQKLNRQGLGSWRRGMRRKADLTLCWVPCAGGWPWCGWVLPGGLKRG